MNGTLYGLLTSILSTNPNKWTLFHWAKEIKTYRRGKIHRFCFNLTKVVQCSNMYRILILLKQINKNKILLKSTYNFQKPIETSTHPPSPYGGDFNQTPPRLIQTHNREHEERR